MLMFLARSGCLPQKSDQSWMVSGGVCRPKIHSRRRESSHPYKTFTNPHHLTTANPISTDTHPREDTPLRLSHKMAQLHGADDAALTHARCWLSFCRVTMPDGYLQDLPFQGRRDEGAVQRDCPDVFRHTSVNWPALGGRNEHRGR